MDFVEIKVVLKKEEKEKEYFIHGIVNKHFFGYDYSALNIINNELLVTKRDLNTREECVRPVNVNDIDIEKTALLYPDANIWAMKETKGLKGKIVYLKDDLNEAFEGFRKWTSNMAKGKIVTVKDVFDNGKSFNIEGGDKRTCYSIDMIDETKKLYNVSQIRFTLISIYLHLEGEYALKNREQREMPNFREWDANRTKLTAPPATNYTLPFISAILSFLIVMLIINISKL